MFCNPVTQSINAHLRCTVLIVLRRFDFYLSLKKVLHQQQHHIMSCFKDLFQTCFSFTTTVTLVTLVAKLSAVMMIVEMKPACRPTIRADLYSTACGIVTVCCHQVAAPSSPRRISSLAVQRIARIRMEKGRLEECSMCYQLLLALVFRSYKFNGTWCTCRRYLCRPTDRFDLRGSTCNFHTITRRS